MTWIAVGAFALAALVVIVLGALLLRRRRNAPTERQRAGPVLADLTRAFERAKEETREAQAELRWLRRCSEIGATVDLEGVLQGGLEAATRLANAAAAMIVLTRSDAEPLVATFGLSAEESSRELVGLPPESGHARAVTLGYRYTEDEIDFDAFRLRSGLAVPLLEEGEPIGTLAIFWRRVEREASEEELQRLEALARALVAALRNAFQFDDVRRGLEIDPLTGLGTERALRRALDRETARARRYERRLSLLLFRAGAPTTELLTPVGERLPPLLRSSDIACHARNGAFAVVLPESALADAERLFRRLQIAVGSQLQDGDGSARLVAGIAELRPEDDAVVLLRRAESALARTTEEPGGEGMSEALLNRVPDLPSV
ncbi:MAG: GAF domain-containing protein [Gaiellaceae bacterium]